MELKAQQSITITRLKTGDSLFLTFEGNGIPLYQGVDESGVAKPDFTVAANQPIIKPTCSTSRSNTVTLASHKWTYNYTELVFSGETSGDYTKDSTGKFAMNSSGWLKIIGNLASKTNNADDVLTYSAVATVLGTEYKVTKTTTITIAQLGSNTYNLYLEAVPSILSETNSETTVTATLYKDGTTVDPTSYTIKAFKGTQSVTVDASTQSFKVNRSEVDGAQIFVVKAYESTSSTPPIAQATINILDIADEFRIELQTSGGQVDANNSVVVSAVLYKNGVEYKPSSTPTYSYDVYRVDTVWNEPVRTVTDSTITITTADTDYTDDKGNSKQSDVTVIATVTI
jgi:hypothetical protein